jgi:two-component system cell cycle response regulator DivK
MNPNARGPILVADDDAATVDGLTEFLASLGHRVVSARGGQQAMDYLVSGVVPVLFIVDIGMPDVGGVDLLRYVHEDPVLRVIPVIVLTGAPERIGKARMDAVLTKPVDLGLLAAHIRRLTRGP